MGDYSDRTSNAENMDDAVLSGTRVHPRNQIQVDLPQPKMSSLSEELSAAAAADDGYAAPGYGESPREKTGGRQKGTPNKVQRVDIAKVARVYSLRALETIISVMEDPEEAGSVRLAAANALLDRAHGKPKQMTEISGIDGGELQSRLVIEFVGQPPVKATVEAQIKDKAGEIIDMQLETVRVPEQRRPWDPQ